MCLALSMSIAHATSNDEGDDLITSDVKADISEDDLVNLPKAKSKTEAASLSDCNCEIPDAKPLAAKKVGISESFAEDLKKSIADQSEDDLYSIDDEKSDSLIADKGRKAPTKNSQQAIDATTLNALYMAAYQQGYQQAQMAAMYSQQYNSMNSNPGVTTLTNSLASINNSLNSNMGSTVLVNGTYPTFSMYTPNSSMYSGINSSPGVLPALSMNNYGGYNYNVYGSNGVLAAPTYSSYGTTASGVLPAPTTSSMYSSSPGMIAPSSYGYSNVAMNNYPMMGPQIRNPYMNGMNNYGYGNSGFGISAGLSVGFGMDY